MTVVVARFGSNGGCFGRSLLYSFSKLPSQLMGWKGGYIPFIINNEITNVK